MSQGFDAGGHSRDIERIMHRTEAMGLDPQRVVRALDPNALTTGHQPTEAGQPRPWYRLTFLKPPPLRR